MKLRTIITVIALSASICSSAQEQDFRRAFEDFTESARQAHRKFGDSLNVAFSNTVKSNWEQFNLCDADTVSRFPQPDAPAIAKESDKTTGGAITVSEMVDSLSRTLPTGRQDSYSHSVAQKRHVCFTFYESVQTVLIPAEYGNFHPAGISENAVGEFWLRLSKEDYSLITDRCRENRERSGYNDWAEFEWIKALSEAVYPDDINSERTIFSVFLLNQMGLMAKLARIDNTLRGLFASAQAVFARKYTVIDTYRYYLADENASVSQIYTYRSEFSGNLRPFDLRIKNPVVLGGACSAARFHSAVFACDLEIPMNGPMMAFYGNYPQTTVNVYAQSVPEQRFAEALTGQLEPRLRNLDAIGKINELLRFLQYDFKYMVDTEQFGTERQFFCEENFLYDANDCEDRAVLFSYLVRKLAGRNVILLEYDDHISAAVRLDVDVKGHFVRLQDGKYYVCDPTFIGAKAGMCIPKYAGKSAKVYVL